jgi:hypothetical protein
MEYRTNNINISKAHKPVLKPLEENNELLNETNGIQIRRRLSSEKAVSSIEGGHDEFGQRFKIAGFYGFTEELFNEADKQFKELGIKYNNEQRVTIRGFEEGDVFKAILRGISHGFQLENFFYSPHYTTVGDDNKPKLEYYTGYVILMSKNGSERPGLDKLTNEEQKNAQVLEPRLQKLSQTSLTEITKYQNLVETDPEYQKVLELKNQRRLENVKTFNTYDAALNLNQKQIAQLTERWKSIFNDNYTPETVLSIIQSTNIPKVVIIDNNDNVVAAAIGEEDNFGNFEITEVFSDIPGGGTVLIRNLTKQINEKYPYHSIFMEANMLSTMWKVAIDAGYKLSSDKIPNLQNGKITANVKVRQSNGDIVTDSKYKNFVTLFYKTNYSNYPHGKRLGSV